MQSCSFFFSSRRRHTRCGRDWSSDVCSSDLRVNVQRQGFIAQGSFQGATGQALRLYVSATRPLLQPTLEQQAVHWQSNILDRKSTRLNSSHVRISYAVFCLKKKTIIRHNATT